MTTNGLSGLHYHNVIKSTGNSAVYTPTTNIITEPLSEKYTIGEGIGRGKFAVVKKCTNKATGEVLAAKYIKKRRRGKSCREEILREVVMLEMALDHPRLVNLREVYETQHELVLITEYCAGGELFTECILEEKFDEADVRVLMTQILEGLVYLHEKNIVHLDLKPQNILLTEEFPKGSIKICDLGFACLVNTGEDIRDIIGTPDYVAPEVLNYDSLGLYTDMWSLGVLTYVMLTTCSPFAADDKALTFANITTVNLDFPDDLFEDISPAAVDFIKKLLILEPGERMTAQQCLEHEWITGAHAFSKPLRGPATSTGTSDSNTVTSSPDTDPTVASANKVPKNSNKHPEVQAQYSEMSFCEEEDFVKSDAISESGEKLDLEEIEEKVEIDDEEEKTDANIPDMDIVLDRQVVENVEELVTPDTESSISVSDNKLESDSGMVTASEYRGDSDREYVHASGRSSTDVELASDRELDMGFVEGTRDIGETGELEGEKGEDLTMEHSDAHVGESGTTSGTNQNYNCANHYRTVSESSAMEHSVFEEGAELDAAVEAVKPVIDETSTEKNEIEMEDNEASRDGTNITEVTSGETTSIEVNVEISEVSNDTELSEYRKKHVFQDLQKSFSKLPPQASSMKARSSLGSINDTVQGIQVGEKHKRAMSSEPSTSTSSENEEGIEYEFISVSKRVRSIEENIHVTKSPPLNPKLVHSPKIARSPRISRHSRPYHH